VALHGGGGHCSNFGAGLDLGKPMEEFSALALREGFALFSLDSTEDGARDAEGRPCGKRWDCVAVEGRPNVDLPFIQAVLDRTIPGLRPEGSSKAVFLAGISNGGFMTILAATHFPDRIAAFAPVAAGDPYGTSMDMGTHPQNERAMAPGVFRDLETGRMIHEPGAAAGETRTREKKWPERNPPAALRFKPFHHCGDGACDFSCMEKARKGLVDHGYVDDGPFILEGDGKRSVWNHFWQAEYNRPLCDFFLRVLR
jgi:poly(3-hydroxybutyrate) depolymerase